VVFLEITVRNKVPGENILPEKTFRNKALSENILAGALFLTAIYRGTLGNLFYCRYIIWELFFKQLILKNYGAPWFPWI
jgi:hypothetical protein